MSRFRHGALAALAAGVALLALPASSEATVVRALSLAEKCKVAPVIVYGTIERVESQWEVSGSSIETLITVRVVESLRGDAKPESRLVVRQGGGQIGELRQVAAGMSRYEPGEEVVLFLEPLGAYLVEIGIGIGKYAITPSRGQKWVTHAPEVAQARASQGGHMVVEPIPPMEPTPLFQFLKLVRSHVAGLPAENAAPKKGMRARPTVEKHVR